VVATAARGTLAQVWQRRLPNQRHGWHVPARAGQRQAWGLSGHAGGPASAFAQPRADLQKQLDWRPASARTPACTRTKFHSLMGIVRTEPARGKLGLASWSSLAVTHRRAGTVPHADRLYRCAS
jgi:hypothetical protein